MQTYGTGTPLCPNCGLTHDAYEGPHDYECTSTASSYDYEIPTQKNRKTRRKEAAIERKLNEKYKQQRRT